MIVPLKSIYYIIIFCNLLFSACITVKPSGKTNGKGVIVL